MRRKIRQFAIRMRWAVTWFFVPALLAGCSFSYIDESGTQHIFGPSKVSYLETPLSPAFCDAPMDASLHQPLGISTIGLAWHLGRAGSAFGLGYTHIRDAGLRTKPDEACEPGTAQSKNKLHVDYSFFWKRVEAPTYAGAGTVFASEIMGLGITSNETEMAVTIGYRASALAAIADNVFIAGNPINTLERQLSGAATGEQ